MSSLYTKVIAIYLVRSNRVKLQHHYLHIHLSVVINFVCVIQTLMFVLLLSVQVPNHTLFD